MTTQEIKSYVHTFIDEIENKQLLEDLYTVLKRFRAQKNNVDFWDLFTKEQQMELERAIVQSEQEEMLILHGQVMEEAKTWIGK